MVLLMCSSVFTWMTAASVISLGTGLLGGGHTKSYLSIDTYSRMTLYIYHWHFMSNPFGWVLVGMSSLDKTVASTFVKS